MGNEDDVSDESSIVLRMKMRATVKYADHAGMVTRLVDDDEPGATDPYANTTNNIDEDVE